MKLNSNNLTFEQSNRFKGLLILLIIFGHISQLLEQYGSLHASLYSFHVVSFLLLPFLFNKDTLNLENLIKSLKRIYIPYTIFFLLAFVIYSILEQQFNPLSALVGWFIGSSALLKIDIGLRVFWFLPSLMATLILIMIFNSLSKKNKKIFFLLMFVGHILIPLIPKTYLFYFPLSSYVSIYIFVIGISVNYIYKRFNYTHYSIWIYTLLFLTLLSLAYGSNFSLASAILPNILENPLHFILQDLIMILSFFTLIMWSKEIKFFETFGKYSLALFTIHPFVIQGLNLIYSWNTLIEGLIKFLLVILLSFIISKIIYYFHFNKIIYPK
ncbi:MAG: Unknown protein [uncultured Sulfurovum sp.]|uniref:Acyltransferase 3 domain-containing protein n=1 Tax=uncultured Sulfurovum sp. TaxID=269237 RepID=A0A6S6T306_9BACT|nr:MAG: Unknown protein [uncultured Sulfurovum sp.]